MPKKIFLIRKASFLPLAAVCTVFTAICIAMIAMPQLCIRGAKTGIDYSLNILIPSLFPFMFLSCFAAEYGISEKLAAVTAPVTEKLFHLPPQTGVTILMSLFGGYPVDKHVIQTEKNKPQTSTENALFLRESGSCLSHKRCRCPVI